MSKRDRHNTPPRPRGFAPPPRQVQRNNNIVLAVPLGEMVPTPFVMKEIDTFVKALPNAGAIHAHGSYHQNTANQLIKDALAMPGWDYLAFYEHDMQPTPNWLQRVKQYDPTQHHLVGTMYFRRNKDDMRPIPGRWGGPDKKTYRALSYEDTEFMLSHPGFHQIDACGLGATAISRWMLERWDKKLIPWFHTPIGPDPENPALCESHDVYFCRNAQNQGFNILLDSAVLSDHFGWHPYNLHTYRIGWYNGKRAQPRHAPDCLGIPCICGRTSVIAKALAA